MKLVLGGFGVEVKPHFSGGAVNVPVTRYICLTFFWQSYKFKSDERGVKGRWWNTKSLYFFERKATPMERINYLISMNALRLELGLAELPFDDSGSDPCCLTARFIRGNGPA